MLSLLIFKWFKILLTKYRFIFFRVCQQKVNVLTIKWQTNTHWFYINHILEKMHWKYIFNVQFCFPYYSNLNIFFFTESQRVDYREHVRKTERHTFIPPHESTFVPSKVKDNSSTWFMNKMADGEPMETSLGKNLILPLIALESHF